MKYTARPTTYNGIQMRSRLEARYAASLDKLDITWEYEPRAFASEAGQYLPDFWAGGVYLEVKGARLTIPELHQALERMEIILASEPTAILMLFLDTQAVIFQRSGRDGEWSFEAMPDAVRVNFGWTPET